MKNQNELKVVSNQSFEKIAVEIEDLDIRNKYHKRWEDFKNRLEESLSKVDPEEKLSVKDAVLKLDFSDAKTLLDELKGYFTENSEDVEMEENEDSEENSHLDDLEESKIVVSDPKQGVWYDANKFIPEDFKPVLVAIKTFGGVYRLDDFYV